MSKSGAAYLCGNVGIEDDLFTDLHMRVPTEGDESGVVLLDKDADRERG